MLNLLRRPPWPLPALLGWCAAWLSFVLAGRLGADGPWAFVAATALGLAAALLAGSLWRRLWVGLGFPLSALALGAANTLPAWAWLAALVPLLLAYPLRAWRDAPFYPTAPDALQGLPGVVPLPDAARVLDAGCGLGHGLQALRSAWPAARLEGIEWSWLLRLGAAWRCPWARLQRADMWRSSWAAYDLVYLFQRPESMTRAMAKARAEMRPGSWLVSLEFEVPGVAAHARIVRPGQRVVWVYRPDHGTQEAERA